MKENERERRPLHPPRQEQPKGLPHVDARNDVVVLLIDANGRKNGALNASGASSGYKSSASNDSVYPV